MSEIERKFLVDEAPADLGAGEHLRQAYLAVDGPTEVRVRDTGRRCLLTVKGGHGLERDEVEIEIGRDRFDALWPLAQGRQLEKTRYRVDLRDHTAEVDRYHGRLDGLLVVEVEFASVAEAERFAVPGWFGRELTGERGWSNAALATDGRPG